MEHYFACNLDTAVVETKQGKVRGYVYDDMTIFKGIPYASAKRFHAPQEAEPWEGVFNATNYGYVCPLMEDDTANAELKVPHRYWLMNENCQNLNIWTPACDDQKRPVMVWLHGGGFWAGSSIEQMAYEGGNMCSIGQVVVVSLNHRLNILGYLDLSDFGEEYKNSGNAGTDDIIAALRWIQDNIAAFGGDPDNVTLFGQSGGGAKIMTLLQTPAADGLYAKGIIMSGVATGLMEDSKGSGKKLVEKMMAQLQIDDVKELETVPYASLVAAYDAVKDELAKVGAYVGCSPLQNEFYEGFALEKGFRKETANVPILMGTVFGEFGAFAPSKYDKYKMPKSQQIKIIEDFAGKEKGDQLIDLFEKAYPERPVLDILMLDFLFREPTEAYIRKRSALNQCTYSYMFDLDMSIDGGTAPWHCSDIPYVFHNTELVPSTQEKGVTEKIEKQIFDTVMAFARTGNPNHDGLPNWPSSTPENEQVMVFGKNTSLKCNFDRELIEKAVEYLGEAFAKSMEETEIQH